MEQTDVKAREHVVSFASRQRGPTRGKVQASVREASL